MAAADHRAEELAVVDIAGGQRRDRDIGIHADDLGFDVLILEKALLLGHRHGQIRHVRIGNRDANLIEGLGGRMDNQHREDGAKESIRSGKSVKTT